MNYRFFSFVRCIALINIGVIFFQQGFAQYYYHDIVLANQNLEQRQLYKKNAIKKVKLLSFEASGQPAENFTCEITPENNYTQIKTFTKSDLTEASYQTTSFNSKEQLSGSVDSSNETINTYSYIYDAAGKLSTVKNVSQSSASKTTETETHEWIYDNKNFPEKMLRIKNIIDTTIVKFICDDRGNVIEEESWWHGISKEKIYYYYNENKQLSDLVRFNNRLNKLLPDYMFEYNSAGRIMQMITVQQGGSDYLTWRYEYADTGLKSRELCYNKQKNLIGRIEYQYSF